MDYDPEGQGRSEIPISDKIPGDVMLEAAGLLIKHLQELIIVLEWTTWG